MVVENGGVARWVAPPFFARLAHLGGPGHDYADLDGTKGMHLIKSISGLRGIADPSCGLEVTVTPQLAGDVGRALGTYLARTGRPTRDGVRWLIGARDGRPGGHALLEALACGAWECGAKVISLGVATTPTVGFAVAEFRQTLATCGGVVITASHNPQQWNGVKLLLDGGRAPAPSRANI